MRRILQATQRLNLQISGCPPLVLATKNGRLHKYIKYMTNLVEGLSTVSSTAFFLLVGFYREWQLAFAFPPLAFLLPLLNTPLQITDQQTKCKETPLLTKHRWPLLAQHCSISGSTDKKLN